MVCSTKTSFLFLLEKSWAPMILLRINWSKDLFFSFLVKISPDVLFDIDWINARAGACSVHAFFDLCFDKKHREKTRYHLFTVMPLINNIVLWIDSLCPRPNIWDKSSTKSEVRCSIIGRISFPRFRAIFGWAIMYMFWLVLGARNFAYRHVTVRDYHWEYPPGVVANLTRNASGIELFCVNLCNKHSKIN